MRAQGGLESVLRKAREVSHLALPLEGQRHMWELCHQNFYVKTSYVIKREIMLTIGQAMFYGSIAFYVVNKVSEGI